jgi:hypothetical protein
MYAINRFEGGGAHQALVHLPVSTLKYHLQFIEISALWIQNGEMAEVVPLSV